MGIWGDLGTDGRLGSDRERCVEILSMVKASIHMNKVCRALVKYATERSNKSVVVNVL